MTSLPVPAVPRLDDAEFDTIHEAVQETHRGRWFLNEFARRSRHADTLTVLAALERMETRLSATRMPAPSPPANAGYEQIKLDIMDMAEAIARTKVEIAAMRAPGDEGGRIAEASVELDAIVTTTATATSDILAAAEQVQEVAWTLREQGFETEVCDVLDQKATDIYTACSFQDLTGQRTRKVIGLLADLERRIDAMVDIWAGGDPTPAAQRTTAAGDRHLLNGPALPGNGLDQGDVDTVMGLKAARPAPPVIEAEPVAPVVEAEPAEDADDAFARAVAATAVADEPHGVEDEAEPGTGEEPPLASTESPGLAPRGDDPMAPIARLSKDERLAFFS
jgi:chemotaxis regulatin CheY-phosphate phosphatase CheZ